jgi:hypothetical protein
VEYGPPPEAVGAVIENPGIKISNSAVPKLGVKETVNGVGISTPDCKVPGEMETDETARASASKRVSPRDTVTREKATVTKTRVEGFISSR